MQPYVIEKYWNGETAFILAGGPSLKTFDVRLLYHQNVIGVNDSFKLAPWIDICWFSDCRWYDWNAEQLTQFPGQIIGCPTCHHPHERVLKVERENKSGLCVYDPGRVYWNKNSGSSAINLAYHLGVSRVVLLGFDMHMEGENHNWHTNHRHIPRKTIYQELFLPCFDKIAEDAKNVGLEILNATPNSAITVFPMVELREVLK